MIRPNINFLLPKIVAFTFVLTGMLSCTKESSSSYDKPTTEQQNEKTAKQAADSLNFISYSTEAIDGEAVYVPVYSHIYQRNKQRTFNLTATLSIRNTDSQSPITISKVFYYDSNGNLVQKILDETRLIDPLSSISSVVEEEDLRGGVGANFLVLWEANRAVSKPVIEAVMISTSQQQGISFVSQGRTIHSLSRISK